MKGLFISVGTTVLIILAFWLADKPKEQCKNYKVVKKRFYSFKTDSFQVGEIKQCLPN